MTKKKDAKKTTEKLKKAAVQPVREVDTPLQEQIDHNLIVAGTGEGVATLESHAGLLAESRLDAGQRQRYARQIGRLSGNQYLSQVIQRVVDGDASDIQRDGESSPYGQSTEFGTFMVYPESFVGPLPTAERATEPWPIREADFNSLLAHLGPISDGTSNIMITGDNDFRMGTLLDLGWLMTVGVGQELLSELQAASHTVTVRKTNSGNSIGGFSDDALLLPISPPMAGPGSNVTVNYNPSRLHIYDGSLDWHHRPPAIGLAHELIHAWEAVNGMLEEERREGVYLDEYQTVGLAEFSDLRLTENRFRSSFGMPLRPQY